MCCTSLLAQTKGAKKTKRVPQFKPSRDLCEQKKTISQALNHHFSNLKNALHEAGKYAYAREKVLQELEAELGKVRKFLGTQPDLEAFIADYKTMNAACSRIGVTLAYEGELKSIQTYIPRLKKAITFFLEGQQEVLDKLTAQLIPEDDGVFASDDAVNFNANLVNTRIQRASKALELVQESASLIPSYQLEQAATIEEKQTKFKELEQTLSAKFPLNSFQKEHLGKVLVSTGPLVAGKEAELIKDKISPEENFFVNGFIPFSTIHYGGTFQVELYIKQHLMGVLKLYGREKLASLEQRNVLMFQVWSKEANENLHHPYFDLQELKELWITMSKLQLKDHVLTVKIKNAASEYPLLVEGTVALNLSNFAGEEQHPFTKLLAEVEAVEQAELAAAEAARKKARQEEQAAYDAAALEALRAEFDFTDYFQDPALSQKVAQYIKQAKPDQIKKVHVYFNKDKWTVMQTEYGIDLYKFLWFDYIIETTDGRYFAGSDDIHQEALYGGNFERSLDPYTRVWDDKKQDFVNVEDAYYAGERYQMELEASDAKVILQP